LDCAVVDLFLQTEPDAAPVLYQRGGGSIDAQHLQHLADLGIQRVYVRSEEFERFGANLLQSIEAQGEGAMVPAAERFAAIQLALAVEIEKTAMAIDCAPYVALSDRVAKELTTLIAGSDVLPSDLFRLARHDFSTFTHVTNVSSYCIILAEQLGLCSGAGLEEVAKGGMLHDIGKRFIPAAILSKPAKLDPHERAIIETHPQRGYEELCLRTDVSEEQLMMTYQHHERFDGKGYPVGLQGDEIHPWARMLAVVDVFDAMTGSRPYRRPATAEMAMDYLRSNAGTHFDPEVVQCWDKAMSRR
jgi:HD-GYP domain-containing protein (c-di-GMP phosphodiesterase class II)